MIYYLYCIHIYIYIYIYIYIKQGRLARRPAQGGPAAPAGPKQDLAGAGDTRT